MQTESRRDPHRLSKEARRLQERYGPWALVTGASDGIGRAMAQYLARSGLNLLLAARRKPLLDDLAHDLETSFGILARTVEVDLSTKTGVDHLLREAEAIDIGLVVAAAGFGTSGDFLASELSDELEMIDVNCRAVAALAYSCGWRLVERGRGGLVLMSSLVAFQGVPRASNYAATKAYVQALAEGLDRELEPHGVDVLASAPGPVRSGFASRASMVMGFAQSPDEVARGTLTALGRRSIVRPGWLAKALEWSLKLLPRRMRVRVMGLVMAGMTPHSPRLPPRVTALGPS
jgi:short-subunit dehydrogenase